MLNPIQFLNHQKFPKPQIGLSDSSGRKNRDWDPPVGGDCRQYGSSSVERLGFAGDTPQAIR